MKLQELARAVAPFGVEAMRWLHQHPELGHAERETSAYVVARLTEMGYEPQPGVGGGYGVKAVLRGARPGRTIALRADMDALPITEATGLPAGELSFLAGATNAAPDSFDIRIQGRGGHGAARSTPSTNW